MNDSSVIPDEGLSAWHAKLRALARPASNLPPSHPAGKPEHPLLEASETLKANHEWHIFTHRKADGDSLGSANALFEAGINSGHVVKWFSPDKNLPSGYKYLPHFSEHISTENYSFIDSDVLFVFLDCANQSRSVEGFSFSPNSLNIDHHEDNSHFARVNCVDAKASSTCELLYRIFSAGHWHVTESIAECLYTGLFTDSGSFSFSCTSPLTHYVAAELISLGAEPGHMTDLITQNKSVNGLKLWGRAFSRVRTFGDDDMFALSCISLKDFADFGADNTETEGLPAALMSLIGVKFAVMLTELDESNVRVSVRSREGSPFSAGEIARTLGGGGHDRAAGATLHGTLDNCVQTLETLLITKYHECSRTHQ